MIQRLRNAAVDACDDGSLVGAAVDLLHTLTNIDGCSLENVVVGRGCQLQNVQARFTVLPPNLRLRNRRLGVWRDPSLGLPYEETPALYRLVPESYAPGAYTFADRKHEPDWEKLRAHVRRMSVEELAPRLSRSEETRRMFIRCVHRLLDAQFEGAHLIDPLTPEELWGVLYELAELCSGNPDPYAPEKTRLPKRSCPPFQPNERARHGMGNAAARRDRRKPDRLQQRAYDRGDAP